MSSATSITFITGGACSGKSSHAVELAKRGNDRVGYLATAEPIDDEMKERIANHRSQRPAAWQTIEEPLDLASRLEQEVDAGSTVILDCLTVWLGNLMHVEHDAEMLRCRARAEVERLRDVVAKSALTLIAISNEVGNGIIPADPTTRLYRDLLGEVNQQIAAMADTVVLMVAGLPVEVKTS